MKKYLVLFGAAILVMAFASPSMAQFKSWGHIEIQTIWERTPDFNTGMPWQFDSTTRDKGRALTWKHIAERYRFYLQYGDPKTVRAVLGFEADSQDWGEVGSAGTGGNQGGTQPTSSTSYLAGSNHFGVYRGDQVQLEVKHAYVDFTLPKTPISISAGLQFFDVGGRMWMNNDAPGVIVTANFAPHRLRALWWRENDNNRFTYGVNDTYVLAWDMTKQLFNGGAWGAYKNDRYTGQVGAISFPAVITGSTASTWGVNPASGTVETQTYTLTITTPTNKFNDLPWWLGLSAGFRPGNFDISGQFIYMGGKRQFTGTTVSNNAAIRPVQGDTDYSAYAAELAAKYRIGPGMFVGVEGYYSSAANADQTTTSHLFQVPTVSEGQSIFGNDRTVFMWMNAAQIGYYHERNFSITGFSYARANFEYSPLTWLRMNFNYLYIRDNQGGSPGTGINALTRLAGTKTVNIPVGARQDKDLNFVGHELNVITTFRIYQNFDYNVGLALFLPGTMYDRVAPTADGGNQVIQGAQAAWAINTKLIYAF